MTNRSALSFELLFNVFLLPALLMIAVYFLHGFYDDALDDSYRIVFMKGLTTEKPFTEWFVYHIFISQVFVWLYKTLPNVPWFGLTFVLFTYLALVNCFYILRHFLKRTGLKSSIISLFLTLIFYLLFAETLILYYMMTKVAVLACGFSLMGSVIVLRELGWTPKTVLIIFVNLLVFTFALLVRYEMVWITLPVVVIFSIFLERGIKTLLPIFGPAIALCLLLMLHLHFNPSQDQQDMNLHEPYIFSLLDSQHGKTLADQENLVDSVKFIALKNWFFVDRQQFDIKFLSKASSPTFLEMDAVPRWKEKLFSGIDEIWTDIHFRSLPVLLLNILLLALSFFAFFVSSPRKAFYFLLYHLLFWLLVFSVTVLVKMEFRVLDPLLAVYTCGSIALFLSSLKSNFSFSVLLIIVVSIILLPGDYQYNRDLSAYEAKEVELVNDTWQEIDELFQNKILVPDIDANLQLSLSKLPFSENKLTKRNKIIPFDSGYSTFHASFREEMKNLAGSDSFGDFYKFLFTNRDEVVFISTPERLFLIQVYLKTIYGETYCFKILNKGTALARLKEYGLRKEFHYYVFDESGSCEINEREIFNQKVAS